MDAEKRYWREIYDAAASRFEEDWRVGRWVSPIYYSMVCERLDRLFTPLEGRGLRVLDVCCGSGTLLETLCGRGFKAVGLDCSRGVLQRLKSHPARRGLAVVQADAVSPPFADASFDVVVSIGMLQCLENTRDYLAELGRLLAPRQGRLVLLFSPCAWLVNRRRNRALRQGMSDMTHYRLHRPERIVADLRSLGFADVRASSLVYVFYVPLLRPLLRFMNRHMTQSRFLAPFATSTIIIATKTSREE